MASVSLAIRKMERLSLLSKHLSPHPTHWVMVFKNDIPDLTPVSSLRGKTIVITGASRGIGLAIGKRCAVDGANVAILAKTAEPHPKLKGTIYTAADEIRALGGNALPIICDIRNEENVVSAI